MPEIRLRDSMKIEAKMRTVESRQRSLESGAGHAWHAGCLLRAGLAQDPSSAYLANLAGVENQLSIDQHLLDAFGKLDGIDEGPLVEDRAGIEDDDVGEVSGGQQTAALEAKHLGRLGRHLANRFLERQRFFFANVLAQNPWK